MDGNDLDSTQDQFLEKRVGEYTLSGVGTTVTKHEFELDVSF